MNLSKICFYILTLMYFCVFVSCYNTRGKIFFIKARDSLEIKSNAFKRCGASYRVLIHEKGTAKVECLNKR